MKIARFCEKTKKVQSVKDHLDNVSAYCVNRARGINLENTAHIIGLLHDMGKLSVDFQEYIERILNNNDKQKGSKVDHAVFGARYIYEKYKDGNRMEQYSSQVIALVVCYHHGGLPDCINTDKKITLIERINKVCDSKYKKVSEEFECIYGKEQIDYLFAKANHEIEKFLKNIYESTDKENLSFMVHLLIKVLYSILIDSDWLDSYLFEVNKPYSERTALVDDIDYYIDNLEDKLNRFRELKPVSEKQKIVFDKRNEIADDCLESSSNSTGVYTLTVPTGGGKTLSSLRFALNHVKNQSEGFGKERIFYIAPYTSIIEQNAKEVRKIIKCGENLLEYHSNVLDEASEEDMVYEEKNDVKVLSDRWDYHFVFTTMVQFLNTLYGAPTSNIRRLQSLSNSVIIFDEVQSIPLHCGLKYLIPNFIFVLFDVTPFMGVWIEISNHNKFR